MSVSDSIRLQALEQRVQALEEALAATNAAPCVSPAQRPSSAPAGDAVMAGVVEALKAGQSIRAAADRLGLDRNRVARLRQRAIAEGCLAVSPD